ncbi:MAG: ABC transporter permease [Deltaproteobacteria bacterium]|nr:ABC transporter permease [Deltaproteobacteria bacterium]
MLRALLRGFTGQLRRMMLVRRYRVMLALLLITSVVGMDIYQRMVVQQIPVAIVDLDNSHVSRTLRTYIAAQREVRVTGEWLESPEQARQWLIDGKIGAVVVIPASLSQNLKKGRKGEVLIGVDASNILTGKNVYKALAKAAGTVGAGVQLTTVSKMGERDDKTLARVVPIAIEENLSFNPATNYATYIAPGLVFFLLHVFVLLVAASMFLPGDRPVGPAQLLGASCAIFSVGMTLGLAFFYLLLPREAIRPVSSLPTVMVMLAIFLAVDILMASALSMAIPNRLLALEVVVVLAMLSLMLSGITWPTDLFPPPLRALAELSPFTPFARSLRMILHCPFGLGDLGGCLRSFARQTAVFVGMLIAASATRSAWAAARSKVQC